MSNGLAHMLDPPPRRGTTAAAAAVAAGLHLAVLVPLLWLIPRPPVPDMVASVELISLSDPAITPPAPERPVTETGTTAAAPEQTRPPPPDATTAVPPERTTLPPPPAAAPPPPPAPALASDAPPVANTPAELQYAQAPAPDAVTAPLPVPPLPVPPPPPPQASQPLTHATPTHPVPRPMPARRELAQVAAPAAPGPTSPQPPTAAPAPAPAPPSNAIPTWRGELIGRLQRAKRYPDGARSRGEQGVAMASFTMDRAGHVVAATLVRSSGSPALDDEALAMIHRAEPLPAMPEDMPGATVTLTVPVTFALR